MSTKVLRLSSTSSRQSFLMDDLSHRNSSTKGNFRGSSSNSSTTSSPPPNQHDYSFKVITLGKAGVGKTSLSLRYTNDVFFEVQASTIGLDYSWKSVKLGSKHVFLRVWDTSGQERFKQIVQNYVRKSDGVILAYDCTDSSSLDELEYYLNFANQAGAEDAVKILVACKADRVDKREIPAEMGQNIAANLGISFFETSAKDSLNVEAAFRTLATEILERRMHAELFADSRSPAYRRLPASTSAIDLTDASRLKPRRKFLCF